VCSKRPKIVVPQECVGLPRGSRLTCAIRGRLNGSSSGAVALQMKCRAGARSQGPVSVPHVFTAVGLELSGRM
jgi:hypothetical protein